MLEMEESYDLAIILLSYSNWSLQPPLGLARTVNKEGGTQSEDSEDGCQGGRGDSGAWAALAFGRAQVEVVRATTHGTRWARRAGFAP